MRITILLFIGFSFVVSCTHEPILVSEGNGAKSGGCDPDTAYFANDILPLLVSSCAKSGCHDAATREDGIDLSSYEGIFSSDEAGELVVRGNANESELIEAMEEDEADEVMPPPPYEPLSPNQINLVKTWINQQALNNGCESGCDTTNVGFSTHAWPMIQTYCLGCHGQTQPQGYVQLTGYDQVAGYIANGRLMGAIRAEQGYASMPPGPNGLSTCEIETLEIWIADGYPNN